MKAALFAPGVGEHGIEVKEIPVPHHHKDYELLVKVISFDDVLSVSAKIDLREPETLFIIVRVNRHNL